MKILVLIYEGFAEFEVSLLSYLAETEGHRIVTAAPAETPVVRGLGGLRVVADLRLDEVDPGEYAAMVIPGGRWESLIDRTEATDLIRRFEAAGKVLAAICSAPIHLAKAGVLVGRRFTTSLSRDWRGVFEWDRKEDRPVVVDGRIVTAQGEAFRAFSFAVLEQLGVDLGWAQDWRRDLE